MRATDEIFIAVVDDDESFRVAMTGLLRSLGHHAEAYASAEAFLASARGREADCVVSDVQMTGISGLEMKLRLNEERCAVPVIFVSAHANGELHKQVAESGAVALLKKPFDAQDLIDHLNDVIVSSQK